MGDHVQEVRVQMEAEVEEWVQEFAERVRKENWVLEVP